MHDEAIEVMLRRSTVASLEKARELGLTYDDAVRLALERVGASEMERVYRAWQDDVARAIAGNASIKRGERPRM